MELDKPGPEGELDPAMFKAVMRSAAETVETVLRWEADARSQVFVYIVKNPESGCYRIGASTNPGRRLEQLRNGISRGMMMLCQCMVDDGPKAAHDLKRQIHMAARRHMTGIERFEEPAVAIAVALMAQHGEIRWL